MIREREPPDCVRQGESVPQRSDYDLVLSIRNGSVIVVLVLVLVVAAKLLN